MWQARQFREILIAEMTLVRGLADPRDVAAALQRYWDKRDSQDLSLTQEIARIAGLLPEDLAGVERDIDRLIEEAEGDAQSALLSREGRSRFAADAMTRATIPVQEGTDGEAAASSMDLRPVPRGRYEEFLPVAEGGMGIVYWAIDTDLNRQVAFKVVHPRYASGDDTPTPPAPLELAAPEGDAPAAEAFEEIKARFLQEACVTGGLEHPGIVPVYEVGETTAGMPYYTMRFVSGQKTLKQAIEDVAGASVEQRLLLLEPFLKVCDTIDYAHSRKIVHRDIKPANIALGKYGEVVVLDWGLAKLHGTPTDSSIWKDRVTELREDVKLETDGVAIGTPGYMSPEAVQSQPELIDAKSDVYGLGVVLYEILCGRRPFAFADFVEYRECVLGQDPPAPADVAPEVPESLSKLCASMLSREGAERPESARIVATAIRSWQVHAAAESEVKALIREARSAMRALPSPERSDMLAALDRVTVPCKRALQLSPKATEAEELLRVVEASKKVAIRAHARQNRRYVLRRLGVAAIVMLALVTTVFTILLKDEVRRRTDEAAAARFAESEAVAAKKEAEQEREAAATSARREHAAKVVAEDATRLQKTLTEELQVSTDVSRSLALVNAARTTRRFDPVLSLLLGRKADDIHRSASATGLLHDVVPLCLELASIPVAPESVANTDFSPDGSRALIAYHNGVVRIVDVRGTPIAEWRTGDDYLYEARWTRSGDAILSIAGTSPVRLWRPDGTPLGTFETKPGEQAPNRAALSPDGQRVLAWFEARRPLPPCPEVPADGVVRPVYDGTYVHSFALWDRAGRVLAESGGRDWADIGFTSGGVAIALAIEDKDLRIDHVESGDLISRIDAYEPTIQGCALSPDGRHIAVLRADYRLHLWDTGVKELWEKQTFLGDPEHAVADADDRRFTDITFSESSDTVMCVMLAGVESRREIWSLQGDPVARVVFTYVECKPDTLRNEPAVLTDGLLAVWIQRKVRLCALPRVMKPETGMSKGPVQLRARIERGTRVLENCGIPGTELDISRDGHTVIDAPPNGPIHVFSMRQANETDLNHDVLYHDTFHVTAGGRRVLSARQRWVQLASLEGDVLWSSTAPELNVTALAASADETLHAAGTEGGHLHLWSKDGTHLRDWKAHDGSVEEVRVWDFEQGAMSCLLCTVGSDGWVKIWDREGASLGRMLHVKDERPVVDLAEKGSLLLTARPPPPPPCAPSGAAPDVGSEPPPPSDVPYVCKVWNYLGEEVCTLGGTGEACQTAAFSPDGTRIVTTNPSHAVVWSTDGEVIDRVEADEGGEIVDAFYTPAGVRIVERVREKDVTRLRDMSGKTIRSLRASPPAVRSVPPASWSKRACPGQYGHDVERSPRGELFLLELEDGVVGVIRHTGEEFFQLQVQSPFRGGVQFSRDATALLVIDGGLPRFLLLEHDLLRQRCDAIAPRDLTPEEREHFKGLLEEQESR